MEHLKTLFSSQALKAWVAGLVAVIAAYVVPLISDWIAALTPEQVAAWVSTNLNITLDYGLAALVVGLFGVVWVYVTKNAPRN